MPNPDPPVARSQDMMPPPDAIPPQQPGEIKSDEAPAAWPSVIGVISIILGVGGCLSGVWGFFAPQFIEAMAERMPQRHAAQFTAIQDWHTWTVVSSALTILIALLLFITGIGLVRRRRYCIKLGRVWAVLKMTLVVVGVCVGYFIMQEQFRQMPPQNLAVGGNIPVVMGVMGLVMGALWGCAFPIFLLIWFARAKVKTEYAQWP